MANISEDVTGNPPPLIPVEQSGVSADFLKSVTDAGSGALARNPDNGSPEIAPITPGDWEVPPDYLDLLNQRGAYTPIPPSTSPSSFLTLYGGYGVQGRPTAERLGVDLGMGGMPRAADQTFTPSNVLIQQALAGLPPAYGAYANTHLGRPTLIDQNGQLVSGGGYYNPGNGAVVIGRGDPREVAVARHELTHAISAEMPPFAQDGAAGFPALHQALSTSLAGLSNPVYGQVLHDVTDAVSRNDWWHVFTALALARADGLPLPPALEQYFAPIFSGWHPTPGPLQNPPPLPPMSPIPGTAIGPAREPITPLPPQGGVNSGG